MSIASIAPRQFEGRPLSCISGRDEGSDCGEDNWDTSAGSGFYTVCCNGDIIDITGFNSWTNYTLLLKNLVCCPGENPSGRGPLFDETKGCLDGPGRPLSELLATSTEVAQPWTLETAGKTSTVKPECFWSLPSLDEVSTTATPAFIGASSTAAPVFTSTSIVSSASAASSPTSSLLATTSQSILSSTNLEATSSATITSPISSSSSISTTSSVETAQASDAVSTGLAAAIALPRWSLPLFLLLSLGLST